jgi:hypothetical protein
MKNRGLIAVAIAVVLLFAFCILFAGQYLLNGCFWWECAPEREFHVLDWEVPANLFPEGAIIGHISTPSEGHGEIEAGGQEVDIDYAAVLYRIYRFPSVRKATADFDRLKKGMVDPETGIQWNPPDDLTFSSSTADDLYIACGYWVNRYRCKMASRYQEYIMFINADIDDKMTFVRFEKILFYLDEQISRRLYP